MGYMILGIAVLILIYGIGAYNRLIALRTRVEEAFSTMDVYLKKRYDLIPNLVETVKGYAGHEKETLENVVAARNKAVESSTSEEKLANETELTASLSKLLMLVENYPQLKADTQFTGLQQQLSNVETDIAQSRKFYNGVVKQYNTKIQLFPTAIIANMFHFTGKPFFAVEDESERKNVEIKF